MHKIIILSGKQGAGKSSIANELEKEATSLGYMPVRIKFASIIYEMHDAVRDIGLKYGIPMPKKNGPLLQELGTKFGREAYGENVWVDAVKFDIEKQAKRWELPRCIIIDDCRFENELDAFYDDDVYKIRLEAPAAVRKSRADSWRENDTHPSEIGLDNYAKTNQFDLVVDTDVNDLKTATKTICGLVF